MIPDTGITNSIGTTHIKTAGINMSKTWIVDLEEDPVTGDIIMPIPLELLEDLGWKEGDTLDWNIDEKTNEVTLTKVRSD